MQMVYINQSNGTHAAEISLIYIVGCRIGIWGSAVHYKIDM
jgi:hypothetical protein